MKKLQGCFFLALFCIVTCSWASVTLITNLRVKRESSHWQFIFDTTTPANYRYHVYPDHAVFYFPNTRLMKQLSPSVYSATPVTAIQTHYQHNVLRFIMRFSQPLQVKLFRLPSRGYYPNRLVVDLSKSSGLAVNYNPFALSLNNGSSAAPVQHQNRQPMQARTVITTNSMLAERARNVIVVIDPGHGGKDPGATGYHGTHEKTVVLAISKDIQQDINETPGFNAVLTRTGDYFIPLRGRLAIARQNKADMFVAIHADASQDSSAQGVSVFALSERGATGEEARWLASRENQSELMGGVTLDDKSDMLKSVLINLSQSATVQSSLQIGQDLTQNIGYFAELHHGHRVEQAAFVVLKSPDIPSLLIETGFISNIYEESRLKDPMYQHRLAQAIAQGICEYFREHPPRGTYLAERL